MFYVHPFKTGCGESIDANRYSRQLLAMVLEFKNSSKGQHLRIGYLKQGRRDYDNRNIVSFHCAHCDASSGDFFLNTEAFPLALQDEAKAAAILESEITLGTLITENQAHWCFPENGRFCCETDK